MGQSLRVIYLSYQERRKHTASKTIVFTMLSFCDYINATRFLAFASATRRRRSAECCRSREILISNLGRYLRPIRSKRLLSTSFDQVPCDQMLLPLSRPIQTSPLHGILEVISLGAGKFYCHMLCHMASWHASPIVYNCSKTLASPRWHSAPVLSPLGGHEIVRLRCLEDLRICHESTEAHHFW